MPQPSPLPRFRATVHYDGTSFHGWQVQPERRTVQGDLEAGLARLFPELPRPVRVDAAGRTDTGVHAAAQEIAFPAPEGWESSDLLRALNAVGPEDIWVERLSRADDSFHPRYDATGRRYEYLLGVRPEARSPLRRHRLWAVREPVDEEALLAATEPLPGARSFAAFAKSGQPGVGTRCRVEEARWDPTVTGDVRFLIVADRFLHHMVRYLVSTLVEIATGRRAPDELRRLLERGAGPDAPRPPSPAPAAGLYLTGVRYPEGWNRKPGIPGAVVGAAEVEGGSLEARRSRTEPR